MIDLSATSKQNRRIIATLNQMARELADDGGLLKQAEMDVAEAALPIIEENTPIITGSWRESWVIQSNPKWTSISVSPLTSNPTSVERPYEYAPKVHRRGGLSHSGHERAVLNVFMEEHADIALEHARDGVFLSLRAFG